jgi:hypothetical protein
MNYGTYSVPRADLGAAWEEYSTSLGDFVADQALPVFRTQQKAAKYSALSAESILQDVDAKRAPRATYNRIHSKLADMSYACEEFGFEHIVDDSERRLFASDFDAEMVATKITTRALMLQREKRASSLLFNTTTWTGASLFLDTAVTWATVATSTPVNDVTTAAKTVKDNCGTWPNALILNYTNLTFLLQSTQIANKFPGAPLITWDMLKSAMASIFGLTKLIVAGAARNSADEGQTVTPTQVWSNSFAMVAVVPDDPQNLVDPAVGRSFLWVPDSPNSVTVEMYREEASRGDVVRARHSMDEVVHDPKFAFLLKVD